MLCADGCDSFAIMWTSQTNLVPVVMKENGNVWTQTVAHKDVHVRWINWRIGTL